MKLITLKNGDVIENRRNGNGKLVWWVLGIFATIVLSGVAGWMTRIASMQDALAATDFKREGQIATLSTQMAEVIRRLGHIETKLDTLVERRK